MEVWTFLVCMGMAGVRWNWDVGVVCFLCVLSSPPLRHAPPPRLSSSFSACERRCRCTGDFIWEACMPCNMLSDLG